MSMTWLRRRFPPRLRRWRCLSPQEASRGETPQLLTMWSRLNGAEPHLDELLTALDEQPQDRHDVVELHVLRVRGAQRRQLRLSASAERTG